MFLSYSSWTVRVDELLVDALRECVIGRACCVAVWLEFLGLSDGW
jgi:hypothetical protein